MSGAGDGGERAVMRNRLALACTAFLAAGAAQLDGDEARAFFQAGLPILLCYLAGSAALLAHIVRRPQFSAPRLTLAFAMDCLCISSAMVEGGAAAAYLFPLYWWLILGAGARLGGAFLGLAMGLSAVGFTCVVTLAPFWRGHVALAASLLLSIVVLPLYGAILMRHVAAARAEAERANRAKTLFLASVSHELRTPLTAILGLTDLLEKSRLDAEQRDMTRTLAEASQALLRQIESLLGAARDEIGAGVPALEPVDLFALLVSLRAMLAVEAEAKGLRLALMIDAGTPRHIRADPRQVLDIVQNVAGNAVKFTARGAVAIRVGARRDKDALWLDVEIRDTGIGVDPAAQTRIFQPFSQGDPSIRAKFGGAGLGLSIVQRQLEALGGKVTLNSRPGEGAAFRLCWPVIALPEPPASAQAEAPPAQPSSESRIMEPACLRVASASDWPFDWIALARGHALIALACGDDPDSLAGAKAIAAQLADLRRPTPTQDAPLDKTLTILLAEDNAVNGRVIEKILANQGHVVRVVGDGEAALSLMLREPFDIIVLDMNMPRLGGVEAARIYTSARSCATPPGRRAPIIALTADDSPERRALCAEAGMVACLGKPIRAEALVAELEAARCAPSPPPPPEAAASAAEMASLDAATLRALLRLGGPVFLRDLVVQFAADAARLVENLESCLSRGDVASLRREAHALESCAGNLGAFNLVRLCRSWRALNAETLHLAAAQETVRLQREWNATQRALGRALVASDENSKVKMRGQAILQPELCS